MTRMATLPVATADWPGQLASLDALAAIPEEEIWLASQRAPARVAPTGRTWRILWRYYTCQTQAG